MTAPDRIWDAATYDAPRRRLVPDFDRFYGTAADLVAGSVGAQARILDLGAGTGLLSAAILARVPEATFTLVDASVEMLEVAERRLGEAIDMALVQDLREPLPDGPFDAVVSALAIHHLDDDGKRVLLGHARAALTPGGLFANADQVLGRTPALERRYAEHHQRTARANGSDDAEWDAAVERMSHDRSATLADQLGWLTDAGFVDVDVVWKLYRFAVMVGARPAG